MVVYVLLWHVPRKGFLTLQPICLGVSLSHVRFMTFMNLNVGEKNFAVRVIGKVTLTVSDKGSKVIGLFTAEMQWFNSAGTGRNGVPPPVSGVPPPGNDVPAPFGGKSLKLLPPEVRF